MNQLSLSRPKRLDAFFTRIEGDLHAILFEDILYILARRNYSEVCMANGKKLLVHVPIKVMEEKLPRHLFCRIHRSCVVAIHRITKVNCHDVFIGPLKLSLALKYYSDQIKTSWQFTLVMRCIATTH